MNRPSLSSAAGKKDSLLSVLILGTIFSLLAFVAGGAWAQKKTSTAEPLPGPLAQTSSSSAPGATVPGGALPEGVVEISRLFEEADKTEKEAAELLKSLEWTLPELPEEKNLLSSFADFKKKLDHTPRSQLKISDLDIKISEGRKIIEDLNKQSKVISDRIAALQDGGKQLADRLAIWSATRQIYKEAGYTGAPMDRIKTVVTKIETARTELENRTKPLLEAQGKLSRLRKGIEEQLEPLEKLRQELTGSRWEKDRAGVLDAKFYEEVPLPKKEELAIQLHEYLAESKAYGKAALLRLLLQLATFILLGFALRRILRRLSQRTEKIPPLAELAALFHNSFSLALLLVLLPAPLLHPNAPFAVRELYHFILIFPLIIILTKLIPDRAYHPFIAGMGGCYLLGVLHNFVLSLPPFDRILIVLQAGLGLIIAGVSLASLHHRQKEGKKNRWQFGAPRAALAAMSSLLLISLAAQALGFNRASVFFSRGAFQTIYLALVVLACYRLVRSFALYALYAPALQKVRTITSYHSALADRLQQGLALAAALVGADRTLAIWEARAAVLKGLSKIWHAGFTVGSVKVSFGLAMSAALALYGSVLFSRLLKLFLAEEVYPRREVHPGLQSAISQVLHYTIVFIGFILALGILGVRLQNLAIIAGALGVGIGFGLQDIVNNFVSGIILLIERPIKVGDVLLLDNKWVVVKHIGIRSTIIQNWDNSEIIVPNGEMLSQKIINWTYSDTRNWIVIAVSTAYGSDPHKVLEILKQTAANHPLVLHDPPPAVFFTGFGESSLDFELRCCLPNISARLQTATDLRLAIIDAFRQAGIEIPFPQRDVWLRTPASPPRGITASAKENSSS